MSNYSFSVMPSVSISRSRFERKSMHKTSMDLGILYPIFCDEVLPGDTRSLDMAALVRMSTPIAPIMDNIYMDFFAFFVPNRIVWDHWKEFMGENNESAGIPSTQYSIPYIANGNGDTIEVGSYADYLGLPVGYTPGQTNPISPLPFRGLAKIYNRWFRNQNLIAPLAVSTGDDNEVLVGEETDEQPYFALKSAYKLKASKLPDYFTTALPYAQKGTSVSIPLGTTAIVKTSATDLISNSVSLRMDYGSYSVTSNGRIMLGTPFSAPPEGQSSYALGKQAVQGFPSTATSSNNIGGPTNLFADLSNATAATINQLRYAFQLQKLLEKDALFGSRYWEILAAHFGVESPDASLQDPEYLGGKRMNINVDQVLSTAGYAATTSTTVGAVGANSVTGFKGSLFTKSFTEHGYLFIIAVARHDQTYGQGIERLWTRKSRYDFYFPVFANLGAQEIRKKEIYATGLSTDNDLFGYQEAWAEYRYAKSKTTALLNPVATGGLPFWTLGTRFGSVPTLGQTFIEQDRTAIGDALVSGSSGPDFICDFMFRDIAVRPMPVYSIPGLIDHH